MRQNLPITYNEYPIQNGAAIISRTDRENRITHCNDEFVIASGFTREELIGEPHNIVHHPDLPPEVFRDMWATPKRPSVGASSEPPQERRLTGSVHRHPAGRRQRLHVGAHPGPATRSPPLTHSMPACAATRPAPRRRPPQPGGPRRDRPQHPARLGIATRINLTAGLLRCTA